MRHFGLPPLRRGKTAGWIACLAGVIGIVACGEARDPRVQAVEKPVDVSAVMPAKGVKPAPGPVSSYLTKGFAKDVPEVAIFGPAAARAEQAAVDGARARIRKGSPSPANRGPSGAAPARKTPSGTTVPRRPFTVAVGEGGEPNPMLGVGLGFALLSDSLVPTGPSIGPVTAEGVSGAVRGGVSMEAASNADGTNVFAMTIELNAKKDDVSGQVKGGGRVEGNPCPDEGGLVKLKYRLQFAAQGATGKTRSGSSREFEGTATVTVDDTASIVSMDYDLHAQNSKQRPGSHDAFIDFRFKETVSGGLFGNGDLKSRGGSGSVVREGSKTTLEDWHAMADESKADILSFLGGYFYMLQDRWRDGACVVVRANVPGRVKPGSSNAFEVSVAQKRDGTPIKAPVDATLEGQASLEPKRINPAPGTETYVAGAQPGSKATLKFVSVSRRGIGRLDAQVKVGERGYSAKGGPGISITGNVCGGVDQPFTLDGRPPDGSQITFSYKPSGDSAGSLTYAGRGGPFTMSGKGSYTIRPGAGDTLLMTQTHSGCVTNVPFGGCRTYTETITLTPADCGS